MRELSDGDLLAQLQAFLDYKARGGVATFSEWARAKDFTPEDRAFMAAEYAVRRKASA